MAHAGGGGGSGGRGLSGARWGRSGSAGHEKLPVHVEDALTYLDQVKIRFGSDPATYNGFLENYEGVQKPKTLLPTRDLYSSIDTPGVIRRVSQLFHEHPDLIVGFNAFLPLGYRIDIPKNGKLNIQSPLSSQENSHNHSDCTENFKQQLLYKEDKPQVPLESDSVEFNNAISYVNKIKTRFLDHPEIYRSFLEILHTYQVLICKMAKTLVVLTPGLNAAFTQVLDAQCLPWVSCGELVPLSSCIQMSHVYLDEHSQFCPDVTLDILEKEQLSTKGRPFRGMSEEEVFTEVANLFRGQEDLLSEFGQFLPEAKRSLAPPPCQAGVDPEERFSVWTVPDGKGCFDTPLGRNIPNLFIDGWCGARSTSDELPPSADMLIHRKEYTLGWKPTPTPPPPSDLEAVNCFLLLLGLCACQSPRLKCFSLLDALEHQTLVISGPWFTGNGPCEMNSVQKSEHEKNLEHSKKRSRPSLLRPVSAPAKVIASLGCGYTCVWAHGSLAFSVHELWSSILRPQASRPGAGG
ncbi:hypothetical protein QTO34_015319 [Cnephaeus nilssonii]|uniref:Uncharacterized protein n=1 Tax=Cnephaeus nilssonii TaxID=3371016 RepID=A0AA40LSY9_CNENI|nr:hypothetical protein QTO34_015319 [Eptesicus nilssonii]